MVKRSNVKVIRPRNVYRRKGGKRGIEMGRNGWQERELNGETEDMVFSIVSFVLVCLDSDYVQYVYLYPLT